MAATAQRITVTSYLAVNQAENLGHYVAQLTVNFKVESRGPAHVAGLIFTTDAWKTTAVQHATFINFDGHLEVWQAIANGPALGVTFEFTVFGDDHRDVNNVRRIYDTNGGNGFQATATG